MRLANCSKTVVGLGIICLVLWSAGCAVNPTTPTTPTKAPEPVYAMVDMQKLLELGTEIILLGTGNRLRFPAGPLMRPFAPAGIGLEIMDLKAACRTYNILAAEGRKVAAALLFD